MAPAVDRGDPLLRVADLLVGDKDALARAESLDTGKRLVESEYDLDDIANCFRAWLRARYRVAGATVGAYDKGFSCPPTVLDESASAMSVVQDESFGPVLTVERFRTEDEAVRHAPAAPANWPTTPSTVSRAPCGRRPRRRRSGSRHGGGSARCGSTATTRMPQAEWGGFKQSGFGRERGPSGLAEYRETKHIWRNTDPKPQGWFV